LLAHVIIFTSLKKNPQAASFALDDYKHGIKLMKLRLMSPAPDYFKDDRVRFI
jgi:hypothetical protein